MRIFLMQEMHIELRWEFNDWYGLLYINNGEKIVSKNRKRL